MGSFKTWSVALAGGLIMLLVGGLLYCRLPLGLRSWVSEEVRARGEAKLVAKLADFPAEERWARLGEALEREHVAPVARLLQGSVPECIIGQEPAPAPNTPIVPDVPGPLQQFVSEKRLVSDSVFGGQLAAAVYGVGPAVYGAGGPPFAPCILVVKFGSRGAAETVDKILVEQVELTAAKLVMYNGGRGVLVWVNGWFPEDIHRDVLGWDWSGLFLAEAPEWVPELLAQSNVGQADLIIAGQSVDGSDVYLYGSLRIGGEIRPGMWSDDVPSLLWHLDPRSRDIQLIARDNSHRRMPIRGLIPSPDGAFLVGYGGHPFYLNPRADWPLRVVDCRTGAIHTITWRNYGRYADGAMAWSADVPNRLYFLDVLYNLWQLDIDLSQEGPQGADQPQQ